MKLLINSLKLFVCNGIYTQIEPFFDSLSSCFHSAIVFYPLESIFLVIFFVYKFFMKRSSAKRMEVQNYYQG